MVEWDEIRSDFAGCIIKVIRAVLVNIALAELVVGCIRQERMVFSIIRIVRLLDGGKM